MKQGGNKKKKKAESKFETVKVSRITVDKLRAYKNKVGTPMSVCIEKAVDYYLKIIV